MVSLRRWVLVGALVWGTAGVSACGANDGGTTSGGGAGDQGEGRVRVLTSVEPITELARAIGATRVDLESLVPAGAEAHDLELTPGQVADVAEADLVIVLGDGFQPAVEQAAEGRDGATLVALEAPGLEPGPEGDPHLWLDPVAMQAVATAIADQLGEIDPGRAQEYRKAAEVERARFAELDAAMRTGLERCDRRTVVTAHEAFGWLAQRYDLQQIAIAGISPDQEPSAQRLAELADLARREGVTTVFTETLVSPAVAETLAEEAGGLRTDVLDPIETISEDDRAAGATYFTQARRNLDALREALDCR